ncbi:MobV family relaxase [Phocaeicola sartorii]|uniref:MobV family relaxase n=1 Tax=Phocaeicola sartorii TaxID=671267 RepID=UPI00266EF3D6|nr:MobV family relaxase [Phocaeicola sartorii]
MKEQYAVCHLQRGSGSDSGMSCHIERRDANGKTYVPDNADHSRTHLNRELVSFPDGVRNRTEAIQYRIDHAGLSRKVANNQCKAIRIILTGTHEQMMKLQDEGRLGKWAEANLRWLHETYGKENVVSCVLHMDEKTPHLHATIVPIVTSERQRREREGERKYNTKSGPRLSADDVLKRARLREYQDTYAVAMREFGLKRGIVGSTARHVATSTHYKQQMRQYEEDIAKLQEEVEKTKEGKNTILALFGKGDLAKARKELASKDKELAKLQAKIAKLEAEKTTLKQKHESDIAKLRNGYLKEIDAAIKRAEESEKISRDKDNVISRQKQCITELDKQVNPHRYRLSSGAELVGHRFLGNNPYAITLKIWTKVKDVEHTAVTYLMDSDPRLKAFSNGELTEHEFINAFFAPSEQVNNIQARLLGAIFELATGGAVEPHMGMGGGGATSELPWKDKDKDKDKNKKSIYGKKRK